MHRSKKNTDLVQQIKINVSLPSTFGVISSFTNSFRFVFLALVVQKVDNTIHWINPYPVDNASGFPNTYPDSDLSVE